MNNYIRRYGWFMSLYVVCACTIWMLGLIILPQLQMVEHSFWHLDRSQSEVIDRQIEDRYVDVQQLDSRLRRLKRELDATQGDTGKTELLQGDIDTAVEQRDQLYAQITELEQKLQQPEKVYGLHNYQTLADNELHRSIFIKTLWSSALVTLVALLVCYPTAFYLAQLAPKERAAMLMVALLIPYWVNELLRTLAWLMILSYQGFANSVLSWLGLISEPILFMQGNTGVMLGMTYAYILFMVFPMYNTIETLDKNQLEAARDLGASWWRIHWRIVIPHAKPGIAVGCIMTFMLTAGSYAVPQLLGGTNSLWFTQIIYDWFFNGGNWNQGAAYAMVLLVLCVCFIQLMMRVFKVSLEDIAK
ncbi:ABC transporter permease subunit [Balneatrix alpica]|uniref:ABC transporter permease subunit n=1 Tax=Balneatrix alpica TaxID=75684 RepID=A0ABV5Z6F3_9GAMM|nr:ABC transporter permease subunit [Balneatrix alpica]